VDGALFAANTTQPLYLFQADLSEADSHGKPFLHGGLKG
jgi:hypothetical protein